MPTGVSTCPSTDLARRRSPAKRPHDDAPDTVGAFARLAGLSEGPERDAVATSWTGTRDMDSALARRPPSTRSPHRRLPGLPRPAADRRMHA